MLELRRELFALDATKAAQCGPFRRRVPGPALCKLRKDFKEWEGKLNLLLAEYADQLKRLRATNPEAPVLVEQLMANVERGGDRFPLPCQPTDQPKGC